jgi:hypothetical protein
MMYFEVAALLCLRIQNLMPLKLFPFALRKTSSCRARLLGVKNSLNRDFALRLRTSTSIE